MNRVNKNLRSWNNGLSFMQKRVIKLSAFNINFKNDKQYLID